MGSLERARSLLIWKGILWGSGLLKKGLRWRAIIFSGWRRGLKIDPYVNWLLLKLERKQKC